MNGAPNGFIPLDDNLIVNVREISAVQQQSVMETDPEWRTDYDRRLAEYREQQKREPNIFTVRPRFDYRERPTGEFSVHVSISGSPTVGRRSHCSLIQFVAKMVEALEESGGIKR